MLFMLLIAAIVGLTCLAYLVSPFFAVAVGIIGLASFIATWAAFCWRFL